MGKRKQPDFQRKKLRVGKQLPKGRNITDTSFKTRQIITPDQHLSDENKSLSVLLKLLDTKNASVKIDTLHKIDIYVADHKDSLSLCFPDILPKLGKLLLESDPKVVSTAVTLMSTCIKSLSHLQYQSFADSMVKHLNCMMSHGSPKVKFESLNLLDALMQAHPKVVSKSPKILVNLLDMVSTWLKVTRARMLNEIISSNLTSLEWRLQVFHRMRIFLGAMMAQTKSPLPCLEDGVEDKKDIHWDGKKRLYLPLYIGGVEPSTLDYSWYSQMGDLDDMRFRHFVFELVPVLHEALLPVLPNAQQTMFMENDVVLNLVSVQYLNTILDILCHIVERVRPNVNVKGNFKEQELMKQLQNLSCLLIKSGFPYAQHDSAPGRRKLKQDQLECSQLNLSICYLFTMCFIDSDEYQENALSDTITDHMTTIFLASSGLSDDSILLILKISKLIMQSGNIPIDYKNLTLVGMYDIMENYKLSQHSKLLLSFFIELSLDYDLQYLRSTQGMLNWFRIIFHKLDYMMISGDIDRDFIKYVRQICVRKYPEFMTILSHVQHTDLIRLLKCDYEDLQITAIDLIMSMERIPDTFLQNLTAEICMNLISEKISIRLIRLLHTRFSRSEVSTKEQMLFVKFLLNVGCDTRSLSEPTNETQITSLLYEVMSNNVYLILPSNKWETHQKKFEVCLECLPSYIDNKETVQSILLFCNVLLVEQLPQKANLLIPTSNKSKQVPIIPAHVALALLRIRNKIGYLFIDQEPSRHFYYLMFSAFYYISVLTNNDPEAVGMYCVPELTKCLASCRKEDLCSLLQVCGQIIFNFNETEYFYTIRIMFFLAKRKKILTRDNFIHHFFKQMHLVVTRYQLLSPLWNKVFDALEE